MHDLDAFTWIALAWLVTSVLALLTLWRSPMHSTKTKVIWTAIVLVLPIIGALGWLLLGRERRRPR